MSSGPQKPVVLCLSGHDPGGGAGIQADIETLAAHGCHAAPLVTCLTEQDSSRVYAVHAVAEDILWQQARRILDDYAVAAIKVGLLGSAGAASVVQRAREQHPDLPLVLDTVLASGGGQAMSGPDILQPLLPLASVITPNRREARALSGRTLPDDCAHSLRETGCPAVLITGADEPDHGRVTNSLYRDGGTRHWQWQKLPGSYHGSGCTLASAIAAGLALGQDLENAVDAAQHYVWGSLQRAFHPGKGQALPGRCP
ncbi:bifunctional hydroxymethylpyrimidine kinase/phosphomethylpyrimidine kinase [Thiolapillus sp.]